MCGEEKLVKRHQPWDVRTVMRPILVLRGLKTRVLLLPHRHQCIAAVVGYGIFIL